MNEVEDDIASLLLAARKLSEAMNGDDWTSVVKAAGLTQARSEELITSGALELYAVVTYQRPPGSARCPWHLTTKGQEFANDLFAADATADATAESLFKMIATTSHDANPRGSDYLAKFFEANPDLERTLADLRAEAKQELTGQREHREHQSGTWNVFADASRYASGYLLRREKLVLTGRGGCAATLLVSIIIIASVSSIAVLNLKAQVSIPTPILQMAGFAVVGLATGALLVLILHWLGERTKRGIQISPRDKEKPLDQLLQLAERTSARLRFVHVVHISMAIGVFIMLIGLVVWTVVMVTYKQFNYATGFGSTSVAGATLTIWKWQPFDRATQAIRVASMVDALIIGLTQSMESIKSIEDPSKRAKAQWKAVIDYTNKLKGIS